MINRISFGIKGDYDEMSFNREQDSPICRLEFHRQGEMAITRFKFNDFRKAIGVLNGGAHWIENIKEYTDCGFSSLKWQPDTCYCSRCGHGFSVIDNCTEEFDFCPHCGAEMDG